MQSMNPLFQNQPMQQPQQQSMNPLLQGMQPQSMQPSSNPLLQSQPQQQSQMSMQDQLLRLAMGNNPQQVQDYFTGLVNSGQITQEQLKGMYQQAEQACKNFGLI